MPMYGEHPIELGLDRSDRMARGRSSAIPHISGCSRAAFSVRRTPFTRDNVVKSHRGFQRTIVSARSPYDRYHFDRDDSAISAAAKRGEVLFHSRPLSCFTCHGGIHFSERHGRSPRRTTDRVSQHRPLQPPRRRCRIPPENRAPRRHSRPERRRQIQGRRPLRNIAVTAPYMHDGSVATLDEAIDHYAAGGRTIASRPYQGVGRQQPEQEPVDSRVHAHARPAQRI